MAISLQVASAVRVTVRGTAYLPSPAIIAEGTAQAAAFALAASGSATTATTQAGIATTQAANAATTAASLSAALGASFITSAAEASLSGERVLTDSATVTFDRSVAGQISATAAAAADGSITTIKLANDAATNAKLANMAVNTIKGRITSGTGDPEDLTAAQVATILASSIPFTKSYDSGQQTITSAGALTLAHSLGAAPKLVTAFLECTTNQSPYVVGDVLAIGIDFQGTVRGMTLKLDATNVTVRFGNATGAFQVHDGAGADLTLTNGSWRLRIRAYA